MDKIEVINVSKTYQLNEKELVVLNNLSLEIPINKISVILGRSGCGKTTLLRILSQLEKQDTGKIVYPQNYQSSYVFQEPRLMPWLNVKDNIAFGLKNENIDKKLIEHLINITGLNSFIEAYPNQISGGMKQRVALARALAIQPNLIYMDEPFAALDYFTRANMQDELIKLYQETNCGILFVTHNIDEAIRLAHQIIILDDGYAKEVYELEESLEERDILTTQYIDIKKDLLKKLNKKEK